MTKKEILKYNSPGELLRYWLEAHNLSQAWLHRIMDRPEKTISEIVTGKTRLTVETAVELKKITSIYADYWLQLQNKFDLERKEKHCQHCNDTGIIDIGGSQSNGVPCNTENDCGLD